jgi:hypothetical protein
MKVDYSKTFIYKLCCRDPTITDIYVGHSTDFKSRNLNHKSCCNNINSIKYNRYKNRFIRENGGYDNWIMIKLYDYPCNSKREAEKEENKTMIELNATLNSQRPFITEEERKETEKQCNKAYKQNNKEQLKIYQKEYHQKNRKFILEQQKKYRENNKTKMSELHKEYYQNNKTEICEKKKVKIKCEFCNCEISTGYLKRHQKTLTCKKFQGFIDLE